MNAKVQKAKNNPILNLGRVEYWFLPLKMRKIADFQGDNRRQYKYIAKIGNAEKQDLAIFNAKTMNLFL